MFQKILIANRGEIALRVIRACRELGIKSAAIYSEADKASLHTRLADESYYIGESVSSKSYLNKEKIIKLAKEINADAIHPGYGFLSENPDFIKLVEDSKIVFIGPSSESVRLMGNKTEARKLMFKSKVPIVPGTTEPIKSFEDGIKTAREIGYPVLLKAAAGGGGKGMRKVFSDEEFRSSFESTSREAAKAFVDDSIYIEKLLVNPRHIEVQILGDKFGNYVHLFERECSIQRRHQKIIEESPSPVISEKIREQITSAAIDAAKACNYYNAGTVEFLLDSEKQFYFLEMNTRLQVEHPVTEWITGIDLVKEQILIASGNKLRYKQKEISSHGHAIECRIYAEEPGENFLPSTGIILHYREPSGNGIRVDSGFTQNSEISIHYDPLISKLIVWSDDRISAINKMKSALFEYRIAGVIHNIPLLQSIMNHYDYEKGNFHINFLEERLAELSGKIEQDKRSDELKASATLAASLNRNFKSSKMNEKVSDTFNNWTNQLYE
ncbi:MAG: acetyl-CoA carboxylase biotin carboxylase subunit [Ignavibacteriaceae bacterium]|nr:acetyl-CoA carboxylase biotin carboxylase subunit [Ignavibacteriaceae bacterium]